LTRGDDVPRKTRISRLSIDEMIRRYRAGETLAMLAAATGLRLTAIYRRLKGAGVKLRPPGRRPSTGGLGATDADLVARYRAGETCKLIAAATGLSESVVRRRLRRAGVEMRQGGVPEGFGRHDLPVAQIVERYRAGESTYAIGRALGVSNWTVRQRLIEAGIARRPAGTHPRGIKRRAIEEFLGRAEATGMSQREIANACDVDQSYVSTVARRLRAADHGP
jgi:DNA-binding CsgD family transcriptional regulator